MLKLTDKQRKEISLLARRELLRRSYTDYLVQVHFGRFYMYPHIQLIADTLQRIADGESLSVIIEMPPRHGKSQTVTETFPSYYVARNPYKRVIAAAYSDGLARKFGRLNRDKFAEMAELFDLEIDPNNSSAHNWSVAGKPGGMIATGIGGSITGEGADCFPAGTMIETENGPIDIEVLCSLENKPLVLSYDHESGTLVYKKIQATRRKMAYDFIKITTEKGREITSTTDHRYYINKQGYEPAHLLRPGNKLASATVKKQQDMHGVRREKGRARVVLPRLLPRSKKIRSAAHLRLLRERFHEKEIRVRKGASEQSEARRLLLFDRMQPQSSCGEEQQALSCMWRAQEERQQVLQQSMPKERQQEEPAPRKSVRSLQYSFSAALESFNVLRERLCRQGSFGTHDREGQQPLQRRNELRQMVQRNETIDIGAGQQLLRDLWTKRRVCGSSARGENAKENEYANSSRRRKSEEQFAGEFDYDVQDVSRNSSQIQTDTVSESVRISGEQEPVYDIQVEGTHNFFANEILVHNCLIIDDPVKNAEEANSATMRQKVWDEWESTLSTRLHKNASVIVIMTRWHEDDLAGRLLINSSRDWIRLRLPALSEGAGDLLNRPEGEPLCRDLGYDEEWAEQKKRETGSRTWSALYQQRPSPAEGNIIDRKWWKYYKQKPARFSEIIQSWDCTFKDSANSDYVVGQVWGKIGADKYLLDQVRAKMDFPATIQAIRALSAKWPQARAKLIEDKANGPAVISTLKREISGLIPINPEGGKVVRVQAVTPDIEAGNIYLPDPSLASWVGDFVEECSAFPNSKHDDMVDCMSQALNRLGNGPQAAISGRNISL